MRDLYIYTLLNFLRMRKNPQSTYQRIPLAYASWKKIRINCEKVSEDTRTKKFRYLQEGNVADQALSAFDVIDAK